MRPPPTIGRGEVDQTISELRSKVSASNKAEAVAAEQASSAMRRKKSGLGSSCASSSSAGLPTYPFQSEALKAAPSFPKAVRDNNTSNSSVSTCPSTALRNASERTSPPHCFVLRHPSQFLGSSFHNPGSPPPGAYDLTRVSSVDIPSVSRTRKSNFTRRFRNTRPLEGAGRATSISCLHGLVVPSL